MGWINTDWVKSDTHAASAISRNAPEVTYASDRTDRAIFQLCAKEQIRRSDIPVSFVSGTGTISSTEASVLGLGTAFTSELSEYVTIKVGDETRTVKTISSDVSLTIDKKFSSDLSGESFFYGTYVDSDVLIEYGTEMFLYYLFKGLWGSGKGEKDIYYDKMLVAWDNIKLIKAGITRDTILGFWEDDGDVKPKESFIEQVDSFL